MKKNEKIKKLKIKKISWFRQSGGSPGTNSDILLPIYTKIKIQIQNKKIQNKKDLHPRSPGSVEVLVPMVPIVISCSKYIQK